MNKLQKKIKKVIHKYVSIPKYERELREKDAEIAELSMHMHFFQQNAYKYRERLAAIKRKKLDEERMSGKLDKRRTISNKINRLH